MSTSVGLAHDTGWDQILSNLCCISKESRIKRTIWIEVWENRIKHTRTEQMEEAVAVWPAWKVHFTAFKSQTHTHLHNSQGIIKSKTIFRILEQSVFGEFQWVRQSFYLHSLKTAFLPLSFIFYYVYHPFSVIKYPDSSQSLSYYENRPEILIAPHLFEMPPPNTWPRSLYLNGQ